MKRILSVLLLTVVLVAFAAFSDSPIGIKPTVKTVCVTPVVDTGAYSAGDNIGGLLTFSNVLRPASASGILSSIMIADEGKEGKQVTLCVFRQDPAASTFTDQAAQAIDDADIEKVSGCWTLSSFVAFSDNGIAESLGLSHAIASNNTDLKVAVMAAEGVTYDSADALKVCLTFVRN